MKRADPDYAELVSIVTPAYNSGRFIAATVKSVCEQTYPDWEMLIADDCSSDNTVDIVNEVAKADPRVQLLVGEQNGGPAVARNRALEVARGRYIAFLDSDDIWLPDKLERQLAFMRDMAAPLSCTSYRRISEDGRRIGRQVPVPMRLTYQDLLRNTAILTSSVIVDRKLTGDFRMRSTYYDDYALWLELLKRGAVAYGLNEDLVRYRIVAGSVSRGKMKSALMVWKTYREIESLSLFRAALAFAGYAWNAQRKYLRF